MSAVISIIMPAYNAAEHLDFSIQSVLNQTFPEWELIIVDDGSTDETAQIINDWAEKEARVRVFHQKKSGVSAARNLALKHCYGKYVTMLDADDMLVPDAIELMMGPVNDNDKVDMVTAGFCEIYTNTGKTDHRGGLLMGRIDQGLYLAKDAFVPEYMHCGICSKLYKREIIESNKLQFHGDLKIGEDHLFSLLYLQHCQKVAVLQKEVYHYIHWSDSAISRFNEGVLSDQCYINSVTLYSDRISPRNTQWAAALLSHFLRVRNWVKRVITTHRPHDWRKIRKSIDSRLPVMLYNAGLLNSFRMIRRHLQS